MKRIFALAFVGVTAVMASAQELKPPKEISDLAWTVGTWSGVGKISFGGRETEIVTTMTISLDGQFLKSVSSDKSSGFTMTKTCMTSWDAAKSEYVSYTFTNIAPTARIAHGKPELGKLGMTSDPWEAAEGMKMVSRETLTKISDQKLGLVMESKIGEKWVKMMDFVLVKK